VTALSTTFDIKVKLDTGRKLAILEVSRPRFFSRGGDNVSSNELIVYSLLSLLVEDECTTSPGSDVDKRSRSGCLSRHVIYIVTITFKTTFNVFILIIDYQAVSLAYSFLW